MLVGHAYGRDCPNYICPAVEPELQHGIALLGST